LGIFVPQFILQPLLENALHHGVALTSGPACVEITASREGERLMIAVTDSGHGAAAAARGERHGMGLSNTRLRLEQLYGSEQSLTLERLPGRGTRISIELPWRFAPERAPAVSPSVA
jgi:two-component system LytT family sensor kinase